MQSFSQERLHKTSKVCVNQNVHCNVLTNTNIINCYYTTNNCSSGVSLCRATIADIRGAWTKILSSTRMSGKLGNIYIYLCPMKPNKNRNTRRFYRCRVFVKFQLWGLSHQVLSLYWEVSNLCHRFLLIWVIFLLVDYVLHLHNNNSIVCSLFQQNIITLPAVTAYWNNAVDNICSAGKKCHLFT